MTKSSEFPLLHMVMRSLRTAIASCILLRTCSVICLRLKPFFFLSRLALPLVSEALVLNFCFKTRVFSTKFSTKHAGSNILRKEYTESLQGLVMLAAWREDLSCNDIFRDITLTLIRNIVSLRLDETIGATIFVMTTNVDLVMRS